MFIFKTRYQDMTFEGIPAKGPSIRAKDFRLVTEDKAIAEALRTRKDIWELTEAIEQVEVIQRGASSEVKAPKRGPGRPKGVRGSRTVAETQGDMK